MRRPDCNDCCASLQWAELTPIAINRSLAWTVSVPTEGPSHRSLCHDDAARSLRLQWRGHDRWCWRSAGSV